VPTIDVTAAAGSSADGPTATKAENTTRLALAVGERDHVQGPATAAVTLVEYGDYECPYCRAAVPIVEELQRLLGDQLRYVFRHFPLTGSHPHAQQAAEVAEAAAVQGRFFEMHAVLFEYQEALERDHLLTYAKDLGLDIARISRELGAHAYAGRVHEDFESGLGSGARGTPTFYLDEVRYDGIIGVRQLLAVIQGAHPEIVIDEPEGRVGRRTIPRVVGQRSGLG
jgi:protein-disulfide isomerase